MKSLGTLEYPDITVENFSGTNGNVTLKVTSGNKYVKLKFCLWGVKKIMAILHLITAKQRNYAMAEWKEYEDLKQITGYQPPEGEK